MKNRIHVCIRKNNAICLLLLFFSVSSYATVKDCTPDKIFSMDFNKKISAYKFGYLALDGGVVPACKVIIQDKKTEINEEIYSQDKEACSRLEGFFFSSANEGELTACDKSSDQNKKLRLINMTIIR